MQKIYYSESMWPLGLHHTLLAWACREKPIERKQIRAPPNSGPLVSREIVLPLFSITPDTSLRCSITRYSYRITPNKIKHGILVASLLDEKRMHRYLTEQLLLISKDAHDGTSRSIDTVKYSRMVRVKSALLPMDAKRFESEFDTEAVCHSCIPQQCTSGEAEKKMCALLQHPLWLRHLHLQESNARRLPFPGSVIMEHFHII